MQLDPINKPNKDENTLNRIAGEIAIESAYAAHKKLPEMARKKVEEGLACHLVLNAAEKGLFDLVYQYSGSGELQSAYIDKLPKDWQVRFPTEEFQLVLVRTDKDQYFTFNLKEPLKAVYWGE